MARSRANIFPALLCLFLIVPFFFPSSAQAAAPAVDSIRVAVAQNGSNVTPLTVSANINKTYHVNGVVSDADGYQDIQDVDVDFYRSGVANGADCTADQNNCYHQTTCSLTSGSGNTISYNCQVAVAYFADYTDADTYESDTWKVRVKVSDGTTTSTDSSYNNELTSLAAIDVSGNINYGSIGLGATSSTYGVTVKNAGNHRVDTQVSSTTGMTCTSGTIAISQQKWDKVSVAYASLQYTLSTTPTRANINLLAQTDDGSSVTGDLFFAIQIPSTGIGGTCSGSVNMTAYSY